MKITKILAFLLAVMMLASVVACKDNGSTDNNQTGDNGSADSGDNGNTDNGGNEGEGGNQQPDTPAVPDKVVELDEFLEAMASSVYKLTDTVTEAKIGLTDSKNVGVDKNRFENEVLYAVPADSEFAHIYKVSDYGITTGNDNNSAALNALLKDLKDVEGLKKIEFEPGVYTFLPLFSH